MNKIKLFILPIFMLVLFFAFRVLKRDQTDLSKQILLEYDATGIKGKDCTNGGETNWLEHKIIAHGAGGIENKVYTNSVEAFQESYQKGFRLFEIDFLLSADEKLVARHSWNNNYGQDVIKNELPLSYDEFMNKKYYGRFTPMDFKMVVKLMEQYPDVFVIIDGKTRSVDDTLALYKKIGKGIQSIDKKVLKRFIPQMFYKEDLEIIREFGFGEVLYVVGREEFTCQSIAEYCKKNNIKAVSLSKRVTNKEFVSTLTKNEILVYVYTLNKPREIKKYLDLGVHGFFSDLVSPQI